MVTCQSSELGWEVTVELPTDFLSLGRGSVSNAPFTFQRCMMFMFSDLVEEAMEIFMDDFSIFCSSFENYLQNSAVEL